MKLVLVVWQFGTRGGHRCSLLLLIKKKTQKNNNNNNNNKTNTHEANKKGENRLSAVRPLFDWSTQTFFFLLYFSQEQGKTKCARYWPEDKGQKHKMKFGEYLVWKKFGSVSGPYTTHTLILRHIPSAKERTIFHIQYTDWPDHGCPEDIHGFLGMRQNLRSKLSKPC